MNNLEVLLFCECENSNHVEHKDGYRIIGRSNFFSELYKSLTFFDNTLIIDCRMELFDINDLLRGLPYKDSTTFSWMFPIMEVDGTIYIPYMGGVTSVSKTFTELNGHIFASVAGTLNWAVVLLNNAEISTSGIMNFIFHGELNETLIANFGFRSILTLKTMFKTGYELDHKKKSTSPLALPRKSNEISNDLLKIVYDARTKEEYFSILIDARSITPKYNGTITHAIKIIDEFLEISKLKVNLILDRDGIKFHQKMDWLKYELNKETLNHKFDIAIKLDQFWYTENLIELHNYAWKVGCIFLDTIAYDINYPIPGLEKLWFNSKYLLDFMVFNSKDVLEKYTQRFGGLSLENILVLHPALRFNNYEIRIQNSNQSKWNKKKTKILITGNSYSHKELLWSKEYFRYNFPNFEIELIDGEEKLTNEEIFKRFLDADIVFIPSRYEGFGLNISLALTFNKFIVVRKNRLNDEIFKTIPEHESHFFFRNEKELNNFFINFIPGPITPEVTNLKNWTQVSRELFEFLKKVSKKDTFRSFEFRTYYD
jgi:hypothetical protein